MQDSKINNETNEFIFISVGCNSRIKVSYWHKTFNERIGKIENSLEIIEKDNKIRNLLTDYNESAKKLTLKENKRYNLSDQNIDQEYYSGVIKREIKTEIKQKNTKKIINLDDVKETLNMNPWENNSNQRVRCYSTRIVSSNIYKNQSFDKAGTASCNIIEIKITALNSRRRSSSKKSEKLYNIENGVENLIYKSPLTSKAKFRINRKFESLQKLTNKSKDRNLNPFYEYHAKSCKMSEKTAKDKDTKDENKEFMQSFEVIA